ncbi:MAG: hypothetical protein KKD28_01830 [Chloroflexi bacterium]|nr:hypothetical protein [Chloroflexota bacterium]MBU1660195.1 hypothetical protein [Chloroflexota bacterium]
MVTANYPIDIKRTLSTAFGERQTEVLAQVIHAAYSDLVHTGDFNELKSIVRDLALAQRRTEQRVEELAQAQGRTEQRVEELAQAQGRTEDALQQLTVAVGKLSQQVGGLSDRMGGDLEDAAYITLYDVLGREFGWEVGELERTYQTWGDKLYEVDTFGEARDPQRPGETIWIVGETKFNLTLREVQPFEQLVAAARQYLDGEVFGVCFCYRARPEVQQAVKDAGLRLVFSYGRMK